MSHFVKMITKQLRTPINHPTNHPMVIILLLKQYTQMTCPQHGCKPTIQRKTSSPSIRFCLQTHTLNQTQILTNKPILHLNQDQEDLFTTQKLYETNTKNPDDKTCKTADLRE